MPHRFRDQNLRLYDFTKEFHLNCPECKHKLIAKNDTDSYRSEITCSHCNYRTTSDNRIIELSLKANCNNCGEKINYLKRVNEMKDLVNISCLKCKVNHKFKPKVNESYTFQVILDKYGLWHSENFKDKHFWAYSDDHLDYIESYVKAELRQRHYRMYATLVERLPKFIKSRKNRDSLLKLINKMKKKQL